MARPACCGGVSLCSTSQLCQLQLYSKLPLGATEQQLQSCRHTAPVLSRFLTAWVKKKKDFPHRINMDIWCHLASLAASIMLQDMTFKKSANLRARWWNSTLGRYLWSRFQSVNNSNFCHVRWISNPTYTVGRIIPVAGRYNESPEE